MSSTKKHDSWRPDLAEPAMGAPTHEMLNWGSPEKTGAAFDLRSMTKRTSPQMQSVLGQ
jgi:hypothetical protein